MSGCESETKTVGSDGIWLGLAGEKGVREGDGGKRAEDIKMWARRGSPYVEEGAGRVIHALLIPVL
jgi:hypothetical protein